MTEQQSIKIPGYQKISRRSLLSHIIILSIAPYALFSLLFALSGEDIIKKVDENTVVGSISYSAKMVISFGGKIREKEFNGYVQGEERVYMEFTAPARVSA